MNQYSNICIYNFYIYYTFKYGLIRATKLLYISCISIICIYIHKLMISIFCLLNIFISFENIIIIRR